MALVPGREGDDGLDLAALIRPHEPPLPLDVLEHEQTLAAVEARLVYLVPFSVNLRLAGRVVHKN
ncbi:MAG: hypothetical protein ACE5JO_08275 [Candidatus Binatia bacterium]